MPERLQTLRVLFADAEEAYMAIHRLRGAGFPVEVSGTVAGDVVVGIDAAVGRTSEAMSLVREHDGRMESDGASAPDRR